MRGNNIHTRAARRVRTDDRDLALEEFDAKLLRDGVHDDIVEDSQLAELEDAIASIEDARDQRRDALAESDADPAGELARSVEDLQDTVRHRVMEVCADRCRVVLVDGDNWLDEGWVDQADLVAAKREAANWLLEHEDVTDRLWTEEDPVPVNEGVNPGP